MTDLQPVLTWVNQEREKRGMEPLERLPKGERRRSDTCPIGRALGASVSPCTWGFDEPPGAVHLTPPLIAQFILDFDNGKYPELVA